MITSSSYVSNSEQGRQISPAGSSWRRALSDLTGVSRPLLLCLEEARPQVQTVFGLRFVLGCVIAGGSLGGSGRLPHPAILGLGAIAWGLNVLAVYLINGISDIREDTANGSGRPIASGRLNTDMACRVTLCCAILGWAGCLLLEWRMAIFSAIFLLAGFVYSSPPFSTKNRPTACSLTIFGLGLSTFAGGAALSADNFSAAGWVVSLALSAWMGLVGALVKDIGDVQGDAVGGRNTYAIQHGSYRTHLVATANAFAIGASCAACAFVINMELLSVAIPLLIGAAMLLLALPRRGKREVENVQYRGYDIFMTTQYGALISVLVFLTAQTVAS